MFRNNDVSDGGRPVLVTPPDYAATPFVELADCKAALGISSSSQDGVIQAAIDAVVASMDAASGGWLGRSLGVSTWRLELQSFNDRRGGIRPHQARSFMRPQPHHDLMAIRLPYPPLVSVSSVKYLDANGADQTLVKDADFRVIGVGDQFSHQAIAPVYGKAWPSCRVDDASVRITFSAGYDGQTNKAPKHLTQAICLAVRALLPLMSRDAQLFEERIEGVGSWRYQNDPAFAKVAQDAVAGMLANLTVS